MKRINPYPLERRLVLRHHLVLHAKCASTTLRTIGEMVAFDAPFNRPTVALIRDPLQRWVSGYCMYLADLARHSTGEIKFRPPHHHTYDVHTSLQIYKILPTTHLIPFESIDQYALRCNVQIPHLHETPRQIKEMKQQLVNWLKQNPQFVTELKLSLRPDYQLRANCVSVQSLPETFFTN
jgi:hypothetical protein